MFEQILKELKTKYKDLGLSETILKVTATKLAKTVKEESEIENAVAEIEDDLKIYQSFADQNRTLQNEIKELKKGTPPSKEEDPKEEPETPPAGGEEVPAWAKAIIESNKALSESVNAIKTEKTNLSNAEKLVSKLKELGVNENFYNLQIQGKTFENDEAINDFATQVKEAEDAYLQATNNSALAGSAGVPPSGKEKIKDEVSDDVQDFIKTNFKTNEAN